MFKAIGRILRLALIDAVRCTLVRAIKQDCELELWMQEAGVDVERLQRVKL